MIREKYIKNYNEISIKIVQSNIESIRKKDITKTGFRVYENDFIGIAGAVGNVNEAELEKEAIENLKLEIPYPYEVSTNMVKSVDYRKEILSNEEFVKEVEELLEILRQEFPDFIFSNKIYIQEFETKLTNDSGLDLSHIDRIFEMSIIIKEKSSINVFDGFLSYIDREYDRDIILDNIREVLTAYKNEVKLPKVGKLPVIFTEYDSLPLMKIINEMNGYKVGTGASLFTDFIGEKKFSDKFTLYQSAEEEDLIVTEFFDAEGVVNPDFIYTLIEKGKIIAPYTDKKTAAQFNLPLTGSAAADYDKVPSLEPKNLKVKTSDKSLKELLNGELGVLVYIASGGDFTQEGVFGTPVQLAFLTDGEKLLGKLPELKVSGELYSMFGGDYIGKSKDKALLGQRAMALNLDVGYL